ncbi:unnamed protein product [Paramecium sonneborni]|uniref:Uncharacterized protein n=1 Tax=Paramecium sonneborni TaxID=65129 RepID=A0A8S1RT46_9CILI|nr:unnamed protein product [Paramecium sonneborni]
MKRYSIGKRFKKLKGMNKADPDAIIPETPKLIEDFIESLNQQGAVINKVKYAIFQTKNIGFKGESNDCLVVRRVSLGRVTRLSFGTIISVAQLLMLKYQQGLGILNHFQNFYKFLAHNLCLHGNIIQYQHICFMNIKKVLYQNGIYLLIIFLKIQINAVYWKQEDLELLQDKQMAKHAKTKNGYLIATFQTIQYIARKFPSLFKPGIVTLENIIWIHTSIVTRCFGGQGLKYVTMVPFCELFNHESADVCYDLQQNDGSTKYGYEFMTQKLIKEQNEDDELSVDSFDNSQHSEDDISDSEYITGDYNEYQEFDFDGFTKKTTLEYQENLRNIPQVQKQQELYTKMTKEFNIKFNIQRDVFQLAIDSIAILFQNLDFGDNFSTCFQGIFSMSWIQIQKIILMKKYLLFKLDKFLKKSKQFVLNIQIIGTHLIMLSRKILSQKKINFFAQKIDQKPIKIIPTVELLLSKPIDRNCDYYKNVWEKENFQNLLMRTRDYFEKGSHPTIKQNDDPQIWNGFRIQQIQQHFLRVEYFEYFNQKQAIWLAHQFKLDKYKRFKLKFIKPPYELIIFCKLVYWQYIINQKGKDYLQLLLYLKKKIINSQKKQKTLKNNFLRNPQDIMNILRQFTDQRDQESIIIILILDKLMKGATFEKAIEKTEYDFDFYQTNRHTLKRYFEELKCVMKKSK